MGLPVSALSGIGRLAGKVADNVGVLGLIGGGIDLASGLMSGEDGIRSGVGTVGATAGGVAGASIGRAAFRKVPIVGTLVGGYLGGTVGNLLADKTDELLRGQQQVDEQVMLAASPSDVGDIVKAASPNIGTNIGRLARVLRSL